MRRTLASLGLAAIAALAFAGPTLAWDSVGMTIISDGDTTGGGPVSGHSGEVIDLLLVSAPMAGRPAGDLGPRFTLTYTYPGGRLAQDLYPYAPGGPVTFSATEGSIVDHPVHVGWRQGNAATLQVFVSWGLPASPVGTVATAGGASFADATAAAERTRVLVIAGLALILAALGLTARERGRAGKPATA